MSAQITKAARASAVAAMKRVLASPAAEDAREVMRGLATVNLYEPPVISDLLHELLALSATLVVSMPKPAPMHRDVKPSNTAKAETEAARVTREAERYLEAKRGRASSSEIAEVIGGIIEIGGQDKASRVSAYLSAAKETFDNVRGQGYGLRAWALALKSEAHVDIIPGDGWTSNVGGH